jgi:acetyl-CoA carboxylase alpha subunit
MVALATIFGQGVVVVGFDRTAQHLRAELDAGALRQARRGMALAEELRIPLVSVIDTPGAALTREAEEGGLGGEIARCIATLTRLAIPTVSVILGQGTGGAALALIPADRILCASNGWLAPLPPEGASVIRYGTPNHAPEMANAQGVQSWQLLREGIVDEVIAERPAAHLEPTAFCQRVGNAIMRQIIELTAMPSATRMAQRLERIDALGTTPVL